MRITIVVFGSRGDVQPHAALALGLRDAGHSVRFATLRFFEEFVKDYGLEFAPLTGDVHEGERVLLSTPGPDRTTYMNRWLRFYRKIREDFEADVRRVCVGAEAIVHNNMAVFTSVVAEQMNVPSVMTALQPLDSAFSWARVRRLERQHHPILYGFSPAVYSRSPDWGEGIHVTGYWFLGSPPGWEPPAELVEFMASGPPPVAIGFGSVPEESPRDLTDTALDALARTGQRGVLLTGLGGLGHADLPSWAFRTDGVPFDWLFPQLATVVYHGGMGTMMEALRAGIPFVCVPHHAEQLVWGARLEELGVGPPMIPREHVTAAAIADAIEAALTDERIRRSAANLGAVIRSEDGVGRAVDVFEESVRAFGSQTATARRAQDPPETTAAGEHPIVTVHN